MQINLVFYILLLELAPQNTLTIMPDLLEENKIVKYKVLDIIEQAIGEDGQLLYRV